MKPLLLALVCTIGCIACRPERKTTDPPVVRIAAYTAAELEKKLTSAFDRGNPDSTDLFFKEWNTAVRPDSGTGESGIHAELARIFRTVYKPHDLTLLGNWERRNELNAGSRYAAIQNTLYYIVVDKLPGHGDTADDSKKDSISDFRPFTDLDPGKVLYLTPEYAEALKRFLNASPQEDPLPSAYDNARYRAIRSYLPIVPGHWGRYWHLATHPEISRILITNDTTRARVYFRVGYEGGEAELEKRNGRWTINKSTNTWIE